mmetsp:Transcript_21180/g.59576  ORF Transcript_21180/g.59576 Transcript_21180/m.59576 type:complete len:721 (-) Transcript_21180:92-2254(-)
MKFENQLREYELPEWKGQYVPYAFLKRRLYEIAGGSAPVAAARLRACNLGIPGGPSSGPGSYPGTPCGRRAISHESPPSSPTPSLTPGGMGAARPATAEAPEEAASLWGQILESEMVRIDRLILSALAQLHSHLRRLSTEGDQVIETTLQRWGLEAISKVGDDTTRLRSFAEINHAALFKILKKHDKVLGVKSGLGVQYHNILTMTSLKDMERFEHLERDIKEAFLRSPLCSGVSASPEVARMIGLGHFRRAGAPAAGDEGPHLHVRKLFFSLGMLSALFMSIIVLILLPPTDSSTFSTAYFLASFSVFHVIFSAALCLWSIGAVASVCKDQFINHMFLLDIDPRCSIGPGFMYTVASVLSSLWILIFGMYIVDYKWMVLPQIWSDRGFNSRSSFHYVLYPVALIALTAIITLAPSRNCRCRYKLALCRSIGRTCAAPFFAVNFGDNLVGDVMTSLAKPLQDVPAAVCYIFSSHPQNAESVRRFITHGDTCPSFEHHVILPVIAGLPFFFRLMQCARRFRDAPGEVKHLWNFGKYAASLMVIVVSTVQKDKAVIIVFSAIATVYAAIWDVRMDWGLGCRELALLMDRRGQDEVQARNASLLEPGGSTGKRHFGPHVYWIAVLFDCTARLAWVVTLWPVDILADNITQRALIHAVVCLVEIARRAMWVVLRIEHEQVANASGYRGILWVPRPNHHSSARNIELDLGHVPPQMPSSSIPELA